MKRSATYLCGSMPLVAAVAALWLASPALPAFAAAAATAAAPGPSATWKSIDDNLQQLDTLIRAGKIDDLGRPAYGIANLFKTLPAQSAGLPADKQARVSANVKVIGQLVSRLDKAGESGNKPAVEAGLQALKDALAPLRALYAVPPTK